MPTTGPRWTVWSLLAVSSALLAVGCQGEDGEECQLESGDYDREDLIGQTVIEERNPHCLSEVCIGTESRSYCSRHCETDDDCIEAMVCALVDFEPDRGVCIYAPEGG